MRAVYNKLVIFHVILLKKRFQMTLYLSDLEL